jgi:hypothetical protein
MSPPGPFKAVSVGEDHACGIRPDGSLVCWGNDVAGETAAPAGTFIAVSVGKSSSGGYPPCGICQGDFSCALRTNGTVTCWGNNDYQQTSAPTGTFLQIATATTFACGVRSDRTIQCWGTPGFSDAPPTGNFERVSTAGLTACALSTEGTLACWGRYASTAPTGVFSEVAVGNFGVSVVDPTGRVEVWGDEPETLPRGRFESIDGFVSFCGLREDGSLLCWPGSGQYAGAYQQHSTNFSFACVLRLDGEVECPRGFPLPALTIPPGPFSSITVGGFHACGLRPGGSVACWGDNSLGQSSPPAEAFDQLSAGAAHTCARRSDGTLRCWGRNDVGQADAPEGTFRRVFTGATNSCALRLDGSIQCWGYGLVTPPEGAFRDLAVLGASIEYSDGPGGAVGYQAVNWGLREDGRVAYWWAAPSNLSRWSPDEPFESIAGASSKLCGLTPFGTVRCWGDFLY